MFNDDAPLSPDLVKNSSKCPWRCQRFAEADPTAVVAAVLWGDPTHIANTSYDRGTSVHNGVSNNAVVTSLIALWLRLLN